MMMTLLVMTGMATSSYAQYYDDYATQVMINAQQRWALQDQMMRMQFQQSMHKAAQQIQWQRAQSLQNLKQFLNNSNTNMSAPFIPFSCVPSAPMQSASTKETKDTRCSNCLGRGFNPKTMYMGNGQYRTVQDRCNFCHGKGTVK